MVPAYNVLVHKMHFRAALLEATVPALLATIQMLHSSMIVCPAQVTAAIRVTVEQALVFVILARIQQYRALVYYAPALLITMTMALVQTASVKFF